MFTDIGHTAFAAHDLDRSMAFYAQLGIHEAFRLHHEDGSLMLVYLHVAGDRYIEVFPNGPKPDPNRKGSFMHLCLLTGDLHATVATLREAGIEIEVEPKVGLDHNWQAWIRDPDGNSIEIMQLDDASPHRQFVPG